MSMANRNRTRRPQWLGPMEAQGELLFFVFVNALDVFMTYWLLQHGAFTESNPIAVFFIHNWGVKGMIYFKFAMVAFVCVLAHIVGQYQPEVASRLLVLASFIVAAVVFYSVLLYLRHGAALT